MIACDGGRANPSDGGIDDALAVSVRKEQVERIFDKLRRGSHQRLDKGLRNQIRQGGGEQRSPVAAIVEIQHVDGPWADRQRRFWP